MALRYSGKYFLVGKSCREVLYLKTGCYSLYVRIKRFSVGIKRLQRGIKKPLVWIN